MNIEKVKQLIKNIEDMCTESGNEDGPAADLGMIERWAHDALQELEKAAEHGD